MIRNSMRSTGERYFRAHFSATGETFHETKRAGEPWPAACDRLCRTAQTGGCGVYDRAAPRQCQCFAPAGCASGGHAPFWEVQLDNATSRRVFA